MKPNPELTKRIVALYDDGASSLQRVGDAVGLTDSAVWYHLKKAGAVMRRQGDALKTRLGSSDPRHVAVDHPTTHDIAWAAGIYEGEGSYCSNSHRKASYGSVLIAQKDPWLCERLKALFGGAITVHQQRTSGRTEPITMHYWRVSGSRSRGFLMTIYKFLSPRRQERIREALAA